MGDSLFAPEPFVPTGDKVFGKILRGELEVKVIFKDEYCIAFHEMDPKAPVHFIIIPRKPLVQLSRAEEADERLIGHLLMTARNIADKLGLKKGYRVVVNDGYEGGQSIYHLHVHVLGGRQLAWPPG